MPVSQTARAAGPMSDNELYLAIALIIGFAICWSIAWVSLRGKDDAMKLLFGEGNLLRMMGIVFIVASVAYLAVVGKLSSEAATLFSGIAGYVLGGIGRPPREKSDS